MKITVFGGANPNPGEPAYEEALLLGRLLGGANFSVLTGGYGGTMEAVSQGAANTGGHVIGVTCDEIEKWRPVRPNSWIQEEWRVSRLHERLLALMDGCDAAIALPGGAGTLAEISLLWNRLLIGALTPRPLILVGSGWKDIFSCLFQTQGAYIPERDRGWFHYTANVTEAFNELQKITSENVKHNYLDPK